MRLVKTVTYLILGEPERDDSGLEPLCSINWVKSVISKEEIHDHR